MANFPTSILSLAGSLKGNLASTIGNIQWVKTNIQGLKDLMPPTWAHIENISILKIVFGLKILGVDWRSESDLVNIMVWMNKVGIIQFNGILIRVNPSCPITQEIH